MFLTETFRTDLFLAQRDLTALGTTRLDECHFQRFIRIGIHYAIDSIGRRRRNRTSFLTRHFELDNELSTYKEVIQFSITIQRQQCIRFLYFHLVGCKLHGLSGRCTVGIEYTVFGKQRYTIVYMLATKRQPLTGFHLLLFLLGIFVRTRLFLQPFVQVDTELSGYAQVRLAELNRFVGLAIQLIDA